MASRCCGPNFIVAQCAATECPDTPEIVIQNVGLTGQSILLSWDGVTANLKSISSANAMLTVTTDAPNNAVLLTVVASAVLAALPQATTSQIGVGETATDAEALAKASITTFVTPSNFAAMAATETFAGLTEYATNIEAVAQVSTTVALVPANIFSLVQAGFTVSLFADAVARAGAQPKYAGSIGYQQDTEQPYIANSGVAGDWNLIVGDTVAVQTFLNANTWRFGSGLTLDGNMTGAINFLNTIIDFGTNSTQFALDGANVPGSSVLTTKGSGFANSLMISEFLSAQNTQVYGNPSGTLARTTFATYAGQTISNPPTQAEVQAIDDAVVIASQRLGALITDLRNTLKPHAT